jgi:hypothetical protein
VYTKYFSEAVPFWEKGGGEVFAGMKSKHEPFLYEPQKKFGTHTSFNREDGECRCRAGRLATHPHAGFERADGECWCRAERLGTGVSGMCAKLNRYGEARWRKLIYRS